MVTSVTANTNPENDNSRSASPATTGAQPLSNQEAVKVAAANGKASPTELKQQYAAIQAQMNMPVSDSIKNTDTYKNAQKQRGEQLSDISKQLNALQVGGNTAKSFKASPNPLDNYATYTYGLTLHVLTKDDYNTMVKSPKNFTPTKTLISSAGRYNKQESVAIGPRAWKNIGRDPAFSEDFYFDHLKMETVIGLNAASRGTNTITVDFTIIEPYGMTLLDRLMDVNNNGLNGKNYLEMPYLLEINFFVGTDAGEMKKIAEHTKWIPIKLVGFKIKASVKGAEYQISAVPFNHAANLETVQSIKTRMEITGGTVGEYFDNSTDDATDKAAAASVEEDAKRKQKLSEINNSKLDWTASGSKSQAEAARAAQVDQLNQELAQNPITVNAKSFVAAYNAWYKSQYEKTNIGYADQIRVVFVETEAKEISGSKIVDVKKNSIRRIGGTDAKTAAKGNDGMDATNGNFKSIIHSLEPGTTVNSVISTVIPQSEYFLKQAIDSSQQSKSADGTAQDTAITQAQAKPVKLWKIIPSIELKEFDEQRNRWGKTITFYVTSYEAYQNRDDRLPKSPPPNPVKEYEYLYTGQNKSVINFDIDFDALYFTAINVDKGKTSAATGTAQIPEDQALNGKKDNNTEKNSINPNQFEVIADSAETSRGGAASRSETINSLSALQSLYTSARGDMISVKLQILGDPEFIKQDDLFINPGYIAASGQNNPNNPYVSDTRSLEMDRSEIYCRLTFKTPSDFNSETGMYDLDSKNKYAVSEFSGLYRVITVTSEFRNGKFLQTLELIRQPSQESVNRSKASDNVSKTMGDNQRAQTAKQIAEKAVTSNPAVLARNVSQATNPSTPYQTPPALAAAKGPDGTGEANTATAPDKNARVLTDRTGAVGALDSSLAKIARGGAVIPIGNTQA